jgi:hypothetical protein
MATPAWAQDGFQQRSIFGAERPCGQAMKLFAGVNFAFDVAPTTVAEWWPSAQVLNCSRPPHLPLPFSQTAQDLVHSHSV